MVEYGYARRETCGILCGSMPKAPRLWKSPVTDVVVCVRCGKEKPSNEMTRRPQTKRGYRGACRACVNEKSRAKWRYYRNLILDTYGRSCACCGESEEIFLALDHILDDGYLDKHPNGEKKSGKELYLLVARQGFPDKYQILCNNCNWGKKIKGICPHQTKILLSGGIEALKAKVRFNEIQMERFLRELVETPREDQKEL